jgi:hypothetical protein
MPRLRATSVTLTLLDIVGWARNKTASAARAANGIIEKALLTIFIILACQQTSTRRIAPRAAPGKIGCLWRANRFTFIHLNLLG